MDQFIEFVTNHWLLFVGFLVVTVLLIQDLMESATRKYKSTSATLAVGLMNQENTLVLDVREPHEYAKGHIQNAINIPYSKIDERISELEPHKSALIIVTCQTGTRSTPACKKLTKLGFENIHYLRGGLQGWEDINLPLTKAKKTS